MQKGLAHLALVALVAVLIFGMAIGVLVYRNNLALSGGQKACTQEAKLCPDGTSVGRTGPNCEFSACPSIKPKSAQNLIIELPPLYPSVKWEATKSSTLEVADDKGGALDYASHRVEAQVDQIPKEMAKYYQNELEKRGWSFSSQVATGGGFVGGGQWGYVKNGQYLVYGSDYILGGNPRHIVGWKLHVEWSIPGERPTQHRFSQ